MTGLKTAIKGPGGTVVGPPVAGAAPPVVMSLELDGMAFGATPVLGPVSLRLRAGQTLVVTGPSGIGKTTLLRILAGLQGGFRGQRQVPARIAMVFQEPTLLVWRSALDNLRLVLGVDTSQAQAALAEVGLAGLGDRLPDQLSLGQQRRLSLARAFAARPDLMLMDEPFVSLDEATADEIMTLFETLRAARNLATVIVTHSPVEAARLATRIVTLGGSPARIRSEHAPQHGS